MFLYYVVAVILIAHEMNCLDKVGENLPLVNQNQYFHLVNLLAPAAFQLFVAYK